ncbi:MAG: GNAT family N-acetyltransferase [Eudoraea sp.]|nr:GNAT family N-acetyltransferase [Eudoraea sp.]
MIELKKTDASDTDFIKLVGLLDSELARRDGADHAFYDQFNKISDIKNAVILYLEMKAVGCGAIKELEADTMEVKRMYVKQRHRGKGFAKKILSALEKWALEMEYKKCVLETGKRQPEAIALYKKCGYKRIPNYGQYSGVENSLCFEKQLPIGLEEH